MSSPRSEVAAAAAASLERSDVGAVRATIGFDAFIDSIIHVVDQRFDMTPGGFRRIETIGGFAARAAAAAGKSTNLELVTIEQRFGGNGPLMAGSLGRLGASVLYIGAVGRTDAPSKLHSIYEEFAGRCRLVIPVAPPATTDALEFDDGKIMLGKPANVQSVTWELLKKSIGLDQIIEHVERSTLVGMVNWVMMGGVEGIWSGLCDEVFPKLSNAPGKRVFIDLCDPAKRTDDDIRRAMKLIRRMNDQVPVTLGLNQAEAERIAAVIAVPAFEESDNQTLGSAIRSAAALIRADLRLDCVVVHPREGAAAASASAEPAWFEGPFTNNPRLSTGAGDHFNGGFALAQSLGLELSQCLAVGCATSGAYVRDAASPDLRRLIEFLRALPPGESHT
ncbi:MAG: carbohydrate kinase family protein [Phycisphaerales bacterium]|nr:carbohydrate kinase family protein [Phycisphaerales bacterium]